MSNTTITDDGWTRDFLFYGRDEKEVETEVSAYEEGLHDGSPGNYETEREYNGDWIRVVVREKAQEAPEPLEPRLYLWNWVGGGYNSCRALSREEALEKGNDMTRNGGGVHLKVNEATLRECTTGELAAEEKRWGPYD